jgi:hypothetical protein
VLARKIGAYHLWANIGGREIHVHTLPAILPFRVGKEASQDLGIEIALAFEVAIESAVCQARACHDLLQRDTLETIAIEQPTRAVDDVSSYFEAVTSRIGHTISLIMRTSMSRTIVRAQKNIM